MKIIYFSFIAFFIFISPLSADDDMSCKKDERVIDACYNIQGKLMFHTNMRPYLHVTDTNVILGITKKDTKYFWPKTVNEKFAYDTDLMGSFTVCPFTRAKNGAMQFICIDNAINLKTIPNFLFKK